MTRRTVVSVVVTLALLAMPVPPAARGESSPAPMPASHAVSAAAVSASPNPTTSSTSASPSPSTTSVNAPSPTPPGVTTVSAQSPTACVAEGFEQVSDWTVVMGSGTLAGSTDAREGSSSLSLGYDLSTRPLEIGRSATPQDIPTSGLRALQVDVKGDGSYNTLYLRLRDATGEVLYYRVGNLNNTAWTTTTVDLTRAPASSLGGNGDGIIDAPAALYRFVIVRNGTQPATGTILLDNVRVQDSGWTAPTTTVPSIIPGQTNAPITITSGAAGDYRLRLQDSTGTTRTFTGTTQTAETQTLTWDGQSDESTAMAGVTRGILEYDGTPDGQLTSAMSVATPYLLGATRRPANATAGSPVAVNSSLTTYDSLAKADRDASAMEEASVRYAREEFEWNRIEPTQGYFDWPKFDQAVNVARARNVEIIGKLVYTADWASSAPAGTPSSVARYYPPSDYADYVAYATAVVQRYKDKVKVWEVWNEPNISQYWKPAPDAAAYAELLKQTYAAIKTIQPDAIVVSGGLAGYSESFLNGMADAGAMNSFDGLGLHTYVEGAPEPSTLDSWISAAESFLARNAPGRSIWITETGWSTCTTCAAGSGVSEANQADYLSRSLVDAASHGIAAYAWFNLVDLGTSGSRLDSFGLIDQTGRRKPAFTALSRTGAALAGTVAAGSAAPSTGTSTVLSDLATRSEVRVQSLGAGTTSSASTTTSRVAGVAALALDYNHDASTAQGTALNVSLPVSGRPSAISVWVYGDNSNSPVYMKFQDANGEVFEGKVGNAGPEKWTRQVLYFDGLNPSWKSYGINVNGVVDYPITVADIHMFKSTSSKTRGRVIFDDITAHYGTSVRGSVFYGRNLVTQALYRPTPVTTGVPVSHTAAYLYDRGSFQALLVDVDRKASTTISSMPKFIVSANLVAPSPTTVGAGTSVFTITGDRSTLTVQVYTLKGVLVRTITDTRAYMSGSRPITWDGKKTDGTNAPAGDYRFRMQATGADGRTVVWGRPFTIAG